jgi:hypothetical protein
LPRIHGLKLRKGRCGQLQGKAGGIGGDEMNTRVLVDPGVIVLGVHPLVDHHRKALLCLVQAASNPEHLIHDGLKMLAVMDIARIDAVI